MINPSDLFESLDSYNYVSIDSACSKFFIRFANFCINLEIYIVEMMNFDGNIREEATRMIILLATEALGLIFCGEANKNQRY